LVLRTRVKVPKLPTVQDTLPVVFVQEFTPEVTQDSGFCLPAVAADTACGAIAAKVPLRTTAAQTTLRSIRPFMYFIYVLPVWSRATVAPT